MSTVTNNSFTVSLLENLPKLDTFQTLREKSKAVLMEKGLPGAKHEEYKFTGITKRLESELESFASAKPMQLSNDLVQSQIWEGFAGSILVFNNGSYHAGLSKIVEAQVEVRSLAEVNSSIVGTLATPDEDPFIALNTVCFDEGIHIRIPKRAHIASPVLLLNLNQANEGQMISPRVFIEVEENAEVTFLEQSVSMTETCYFVNAVTEARVGKNARVRYTRLQNENRNIISESNFKADVHRDATFTSTVISLSGGMVRNNLNLRLLDSGCEGNMYGLYLLNGKTHVDNHTVVDHTKPHAESNELYKGILTDQSRGVFNGKIFVRQDAQKTNAFQQNNNILLSNDAIVNTKPQLEIWADDVKCSHGCTTGQLDEEALFYLQARGIDKVQAKGLLLYAFAGEILEQIKEESFYDYIVGLVRERLGSNF